MAKLDQQWIELFRAGKYGEKGEYSPADLDEIVRNFDPAFHEPPVVVGHPENNAPAFGWVEGLKRSGSLLLGKLKQVEPQFEQMVADGRFKKRSVALYRSDKGWALRHVGFLGAQPPEIKGLADAKFKDEQSQNTEFMFEEESVADQEKNIIERLNAWFDEKFGGKNAPAGKTFTEDEVKAIATAAAAEAVKPLQAKLDAQGTQFSEREKTFTAAAVVARAKAAIAGLQAQKLFVPAFEKMGLGIIFEELAKIDTQVEFGEGDQKKKQTPLEIAVAFFEALPKIVPFGEVYTGQAATKLPKNVTANETPSVALDQASVEFDGRVRKFAEDNKTTYGDAYHQLVLRGEGPNASGSASAGAV